MAFTMTLVASALLYLRSRNPVWALGVGASAALIFATKETGVITVVVLAIAAVVSGIYVNWRAGGTAGRGARPAPAGARTSKPAKTVRIDGVEYRAVPDRSSRSLLDGVIPGGIPPDHVVASTIVFLCVYVLFFSSFFTNFPQGVVDSLATFTIWTQTGGATQVAPPQQYLVWMATADAPILILGTIGGLLAAIQGRSRLWVFVGLWALGITLAYSFVSYKTPGSCSTCCCRSRCWAVSPFGRPRFAALAPGGRRGRRAGHGSEHVPRLRPQLRQLRHATARATRTSTSTRPARC